MITKERLEDLIKENKKVYYTQNHLLTEDAIWIDLTGAEIIPSQECVALSYKIYNNYGYVNCFPFKWLFETKEDAEFALKYKRIPRTEYLDLPTWEEFIKICENSDYGYNEITIFDDVRFGYKSKPNGDDGTIYINKGIKTLFMTRMVIKENYLEACEICRKLWLGEEIC